MTDDHDLKKEIKIFIDQADCLLGEMDIVDFDHVYNLHEYVSDFLDNIRSTYDEFKNKVSVDKKDAKDKELLEKIFCIKPDKQEPHSWTDWKSGQSDYKPFSLQLSECTKNRDAFLEKCFVCGHELLMCKKYGGQCRSGTCKEERVGNDTVK